MRFYFVYRGRGTPSGGHKQCRLMVSLLRELGQDAWLLLDGTTSDGPLYNVQVPEAPFLFEEAGRHLNEDDAVVMPEANIGRYLPTAAAWKCRKAVNNQNAFYALQSRPVGGYGRNGIEFAI